MSNQANSAFICKPIFPECEFMRTEKDKDLYQTISRDVFDDAESITPDLQDVN